MKTIASTKNLRIRIAHFVTLTILVLLWMDLHADEFTKTYQEKYSVEKGATLTVQNKYGKVHCQVWDENSVSMTVTIRVDASNQENVDKIFEKISIEMKGSPTAVSGVTKVGNISKADFSIDYDIKMPRWININLDNRFGDIFLDEVNGAVEINLEYGALETFALNNTANNLVIKFSKAKTGHIKEGEISIEYSSLNTTGAGNIKITSRFSELALENIGSIILDSQYDKIRSGTMESIIAVSRFTDFFIGRINNEFDFDMEYGELTVGHLPPGFVKGSIRNSFAGAKLTIDPKTSFNLNAEMSFGDLTYPKSNVTINKETVGYTTNRYQGKIGTTSSPIASLSIKSKYSNTSINFEK